MVSGRKSVACIAKHLENDLRLMPSFVWSLLKCSNRRMTLLCLMGDLSQQGGLIQITSGITYLNPVPHFEIHISPKQVGVRTHGDNQSFCSECLTAQSHPYSTPLMELCQQSVRCIHRTETIKKVNVCSLPLGKLPLSPWDFLYLHRLQNLVVKAMERSSLDGS